MRTVVVSRFGGPEVLQPRAAPAPRPGPGQVAIDVDVVEVEEAARAHAAIERREVVGKTVLTVRR